MPYSDDGSSFTSTKQEKNTKKKIWKKKRKKMKRKNKWNDYIYTFRRLI